MQKMYSCVDIAERYGVQVITVWDWIRKRKLPAMKIGRDYRISDKDIEVFEESCRTVK
jgi:excisionase family DNA binding protein